MAVEAGILERRVVSRVVEYRPTDGSIASWQSKVLPRVVVAWAGLPDDPAYKDPPVEWHMMQDSLAQVNDSGVSFLKIADLIDDQL